VLTHFTPSTDPDDTYGRMAVAVRAYFKGDVQVAKDLGRE
jgi:hypothetical protein